MAGTKRGHESTADAVKSKKSKRKQSSFTRRSTIEIVVEGHEDEPFCVHPDVLSALSKEFELIFLSLAEGQKSLTIKNLSFEMFDVFLQWLYAVRSRESNYDSLSLDAVDEVDLPSDDEDYGNVDITRSDWTFGDLRVSDTRQDQTTGPKWLRKPAVEARKGDTTDAPLTETTNYNQTPPTLNDLNVLPLPRQNFTRKHRVYLDLVDLYIFAVRYDIRCFRAVVVLTIQRLIREWRLLPNYFVMKYALDNLTIDAPLSRFFILCAAYYDEIPSKVACTWPSDFLGEVLHLVVQRIPNGPFAEYDVVHDLGMWCDYHEHVHDEEEACQAARCECYEGELEAFTKSSTDTEMKIRASERETDEVPANPKKARRRGMQIEASLEDHDGLT